ncbi:hypothetical protein J1614_008170 [Plenodomus biglobosus]|nr:hypothetical protein J1614_008170 [Plenodomus biglobosus]
MLEEFSKRQASKTTELIAAAGLTELNLALEIADILDELNMLLLLLEKQKTVLIALEEHFQKLKPLEVKTDNGKPKLHITQSNFDRLAIRNESSSGGEIHVVDVFAKNMDVLLENKVGNAFLATRIDGEAGVQMSQAMRRLQTETANIKRLRGEAKQAHKMVRLLQSGNRQDNFCAHADRS